MGRYVATYSKEKGAGAFMFVTYSDLFTFVTMLVAVITLVYNMTKHNKK